MFRHKKSDARSALDKSARTAGQVDGRQRDERAATNDKNLVFLHGYNVNPIQAHGWFAEMYKRFYCLVLMQSSTALRIVEMKDR